MKRQVNLLSNMASIGNELVWAEERREITQSARRAAKRGEKQEQERIKKGWRWVQVGTRTKILVPCDKEGNPTTDGQMRIQRLKENLGIK